MILYDFVTRVCDDANLNPTIQTVYSRVVRETNRVCEEVWNGYRWSFRWKNYRIVTDVDETTGSVSVTDGSRTLTGSGTSFSSSHVGWHINFPGDNIQNWYKIKAYTSSTSLELDVPYTGTSGSKSYVLRHFDYTLPTEPWDFAGVSVSHGKKNLDILEPTSMDLLGPVPNSSGSPEAVSIYSSDSSPTVYSTGSVSGTVDTRTLTGSGTSWLSNIYPGDKVVIGSNSYRVQSVDSDTQITLYNYQQVTVSASAYSITRQFGRIMRIMWPSNNKYTLDLRALRLYQPLVNNNDTNELLYRCSNAIALKVSALELKRQPDKRHPLLEQDAELALQRARAEDDTLTPKEQIASIYSYRIGSRSGWRNY